MADSAATDLLDDLTTNIDALESTLQPLLSQPVHKTAVSYSEPLDKAKLYTLTTYAIESVLLSYDRLNVASNPEDARAHPITDELKRVQAYMQKIDAVENPQSQSLAIDKPAVKRFIDAGLAGNKAYDKLRTSREEEAKQEAKRKLAEIGGADVEKTRKKKSKRSKESVLDAPEDKLELVQGSEDKPKKRKKKSKSGGEGT